MATESIPPAPKTTPPLRVGIVANEPSGDQLGASLIRALREIDPNATFEGVGGPLMQTEGCVSRVPMERLTVMGLVEVLKHLPDLLSIRRRLYQHFLDSRPDVFIGIDAPDFNLGLERRLRDTGIKTVHYVSPTVWAWREGRVKHIRRSVDLLLSIFPFEREFLERHQVPVRYVGHPLAEQIPLDIDQAGARRRLELDASAPLLALLPGSRVSEVTRLGRTFIESAQWCLERKPDLTFAAPMVNAAVRDIFEQQLRDFAPALQVHLVDGNSRDVLAASDLVLTASGTATFETLLHKRPMVVGYRVSEMTWRIGKLFKLLKVPYVAMANLLAGEALAPERIQDNCRAVLIGPDLLAFLDDPQRVADIQRRYLEIHQSMRRDSGRQAAEAVLELIGRGGEK